MTTAGCGEVRVERLALPGEDNMWIVGDELECAVVDAAGAPELVLERVGSRRLLALLCTHAHAASAGATLAVADATGAPIHLHPDDFPLWLASHPGRWPDRSALDGMTLDVAGVRLEALHTPGHTPGSVCWYADALDAVFTGGTLEADGPGPADLPRASYTTLLSSIRRRLFTLRPDTVVHPGHGPDTRIATQRWHAEFWG